MKIYNLDETILITNQEELTNFLDKNNNTLQGLTIDDVTFEDVPYALKFENCSIYGTDFNNCQRLDFSNCEILRISIINTISYDVTIFTSSLEGSVISGVDEFYSDHNTIENVTIENTNTVNSYMSIFEECVFIDLEDDYKFRKTSLFNCNFLNKDEEHTHYFIQVNSLGSRNDLLTYDVINDVISTGCFKGSLTKFKAAVKYTHSNNKFVRKKYLATIKYLKSLHKLYK